jgi:hypothetical protein
MAASATAAIDHPGVLVANLRPEIHFHLSR